MPKVIFLRNVLELLDKNHISYKKKDVMNNRVFRQSNLIRYNSIYTFDINGIRCELFKVFINGYKWIIGDKKGKILRDFYSGIINILQMKEN